MGVTESSFWPRGMDAFCLCVCPVFCHHGVKLLFWRGVMSRGSVLASEILGDFFGGKESVLAASLEICQKYMEICVENSVGSWSRDCPTLRAGGF